MDDDRIKGAEEQVAGALKQGTGKLLGDAKLQADGAAEQARGDAANPPAPSPGQCAGIDTDRIKGVGRQIKGTIELGLGRLIGDQKLADDGTAERAAGKAQNEAGSRRDAARDALKPKIP
jgi:uncharacterized protein YjbJ (UPF0337 family)